MGSWFNSRQTLQKSQYYVWFLGSKPCQGLRGKELVLPVMRQLLADSLRHFPNKVTIQVSEKGLKLIQTVPTINKSGKLKMELVKCLIPAHSLSFCVVGDYPYDDAVGCILVMNSESRTPACVHCFRCDSPETAAIFHGNLQTLLSRPENQRRLMQLERRLLLEGLLVVPRPLIRTSGDSSPANDEPTADYTSEEPAQSSVSPLSDGGVTTDSDREESSGSETEKMAQLHRALFAELKEKICSKLPIYVPPKDYPKPAPRKSLGKIQTRGDDAILTSGSHGLGSELPFSKGRFRYSIAGTPREWNDFESNHQLLSPKLMPKPKKLEQRPESPVYDSIADGGTEEPRLLRMFGDTFRFTRRQRPPVPVTPVARYPHWTPVHRSMDNLLSNGPVQPHPFSIADLHKSKSGCVWQNPLKRSFW